MQIPSRPIQPNFSKDELLYFEAYHTLLFTGIDIHFLNESNSISRDDYANGYTIFAFDLTPNLSANWTLESRKTRKLTIRSEI